MPAGWAAGAAAGGSILGGLISAGGAEAGAAQQAAYERQALQQQQSMFNTEQGNEQPYIQGGAQAQNQLNFLLGEGGQTNPDGTPITSSAGGYGSLNKTFDMNDFKNLTPQYNFNLQQGAQGTLNNSSSGQGALSGSALKDLIGYNQNFANNSFNSAFANYNTQQNNIFGRLSNIATLGASAGSNSTTGAGQFSGQIGNTTAGIGAALGAGSVAAGNDLGKSASSLGGILGAYGGGGGAPTSTVGYQGPDTTPGYS
jgi:hypothetical protein